MDAGGQPFANLGGSLIGCRQTESEVCAAVFPPARGARAPFGIETCIKNGSFASSMRSEIDTGEYL